MPAGGVTMKMAVVRIPAASGEKGLIVALTRPSASESSRKRLSCTVRAPELRGSGSALRPSKRSGPAADTWQIAQPQHLHCKWPRWEKLRPFCHLTGPTVWLHQPEWRRCSSHDCLNESLTEVWIVCRDYYGNESDRLWRVVTPHTAARNLKQSEAELYFSKISKNTHVLKQSWWLEMIHIEKILTFPWSTLKPPIFRWSHITASLRELVKNIFLLSQFSINTQQKKKKCWNVESQQHNQGCFIYKVLHFIRYLQF